MADQKPGFFRRLLGDTQAQPPAPPPPPADTPGPPETRPPTAPQPKQSWFQRLASGLKRSSDQLTGGIASVFTKKRLDNAMLDELEDILIQADFGLDMASSVTEALRRDRFDRDISTDDVRELLSGEVRKAFFPVSLPLTVDADMNPFVILMGGGGGAGGAAAGGGRAAL